MTEMSFKHVDWDPSGRVVVLDQTRLPSEEVYLSLDSIDGMVEAIRQLRVRGAPLIGVAAAMGLAAAAANRAESGGLTAGWFQQATSELSQARPTAVNLAWAIDRMRSRIQDASAWNDQKGLAAILRGEAQAIWEEDQAMCRAIGVHGADLLPVGATVLTHCNAGALATGGIGTALAVIYEAHRQGKEPVVISTETRPLRQGARLTAWELHRNGVPVTSIIDSAAASLIAGGRIDVVLTGADRIARNGDVANKIGTYALAVLAKTHGIPFYVAAPASTYDPLTECGNDIPIEERSTDELALMDGVPGFNPAFDVTPARYVDGLVLDVGVLRPPLFEALGQVTS